MHYETDVDSNALLLEGGIIRAMTDDEFARIEFLDPILPVRGMPPVLQTGFAVITTVAEYGIIPIEAHTSSADAGLPDESWTDVVDITVGVDDVADGGLIVRGFDGPEFDRPPLTPTPGVYRLRISAKGRNLPWIDDVAERYRFDAWPVTGDRSPVIHRSSSP